MPVKEINWMLQESRDKIINNPLPENATEAEKKIKESLEGYRQQRESRAAYTRATREYRKNDEWYQRWMKNGPIIPYTREAEINRTATGIDFIQSIESRDLKLDFEKRKADMKRGFVLKPWNDFKEIDNRLEKENLEEKGKQKTPEEESLEKELRKAIGG